MKKIRLIILEDNLLMRQSLGEMLQMEEGLEVVAMYDNAKNIVAAYETYNPDLILTDIDMPGVNGLEGLKELKEKYPDAKVLVLTVFDDNDKVLSAICLGANGYLLKSTTTERIIEAITETIDGGAPLTPAVANKILKYFPKQPLIFSAEVYSLTEKEKEVLQFMVKGYSYKMIAAELNKSVETIRVQIKSIYKKMQVQSNAEAIIKALGRVY